MTQAVDLANAINTFVKGCKTDGTWDAIKACCIMAAWDGLTGALYPLKGPAPTNNNFVAADYNRETGLVGDANTKYLNSNRNNNADPQDNRHVSVWVHTASTALTYAGEIGYYTATTAGNTYIGRSNASAQVALSSLIVALGSSTMTGFRGITRNGSSSFDRRASSTTTTVSSTSLGPKSGNIEVFRGGSSSLISNARLSFYSIGEDLDLALLDARVSTLMTDIGAAIP